MNRNDLLLVAFYTLLTMFISPHSCVRPRNRCSAVSIPNGKMAVRHRGRVGRFLCNTGYKLIGDKIATCHEGVWDTIPHCVKDIECPKVMPKVMNGKMVPFNYVFFKVVCNPGFRVPLEIQSIFPCEQFFDPDVKPPVCQLTAEQFCDFETDMCNWNNTVPYFPWILYQNATPSHALRTGPEGDHTYGTGHYLYIEASGLPSNEERFAKLVRRFWKVDTPEVCFVFWYHMYGFNIGTLDVYVDYVKVFTKTGNLGDKWRKGVIQKLPSDRDFYITMVATTGNGYAGDIAIDDIGLVNSTDCTKMILIETSCKNRCFEVETNSSLCKCSSECLIESNCCPDFMQTCGADALKSTSSSDASESTYATSSSSLDVEYSTVSYYSSSLDDSSTFDVTSGDEIGTTTDGSIQSPGTVDEVQASSYQSNPNSAAEGLLTSDDPLVTKDSVIKITEPPKVISKQSRDYSDLVNEPTYSLKVDTSRRPTTPRELRTSLNDKVLTEPSKVGNDVTETWKQSSEAMFHPVLRTSSTTVIGPVVSVTLGSHEDIVNMSDSMSHSMGVFNSITISGSSSVQAPVTHSASEQYASSLLGLNSSTVPSSTLPATSQPTPTKMHILTTDNVISTTIKRATEKPSLKLTTLHEKTERTTSSAETTQKPPMKTTKAITNTTKAPMKTTELPTKTTKAFTNTTKAPIKTTEVFTNTTKAPMKTTEVPMKTTKAFTNTTKAPMKTTKTPMKTTKTFIKTTEVPTKTTEAKTPMKSTKTIKITDVIISTVQQIRNITVLPVTLSLSHFSSTESSNDGDSDIDESIEPDFITSKPREELSSRPTNYNAVKPSQEPYKRRKTYVPKGRYTFSAVRSESKTTTYVSIFAGILIFLSAAFFAGYVFRRRRSNLFRGSTEESDVLYMTSDEILDFNVARINPSSGSTAPSSSQQMLCQTEY